MTIQAKQLLKKIPGLVEAVHFVKNRRYDAMSRKAFSMERQIRREGPVKVGFLCQYIPAWTKVEKVYLNMLEDSRFEPYLICLPSGIKHHQLIDPDSLENDTFDYFLQHGYPQAINALIGKNTWLDLKALELQYIFYPRPYNDMMPSAYTSHEVSKHCKICMLMYCIEPTQEITVTTLNRDFMSHVYCYFAEHSFVLDTNIKNNRYLHKKGWQKTVCIGVPVLEQMLEQRGKVSPSWEFSKNDFRVIWTPRWTTDLDQGGSNFFTYWKSLPAFAQMHPEMDFLFRPHPLTFSHFIETGELTPRQVEDFQAMCEEMPNVSLDRESAYDATLWGSSVLVSDISGIMPEYFITGKPLIYCASNMVLKLSAFATRMLEGCYVVNESEDLFRCLEMLASGEDPLKEKRERIVQEIYGSTNDGASERIVEMLAENME